MRDWVRAINWADFGADMGLVGLGLVILGAGIYVFSASIFYAIQVWL